MKHIVLQQIAMLLTVLVLVLGARRFVRFEIRDELSQLLRELKRHMPVYSAETTQGREAQWRPCRLEAAPLKDAAHWIEHYRRFWEHSFDQLDNYLHNVQSKEGKRARKRK